MGGKVGALVEGVLAALVRDIAHTKSALGALIKPLWDIHEHCVLRHVETIQEEETKQRRRKQEEESKKKKARRRKQEERRRQRKKEEAGWYLLFE